MIKKTIILHIIFSLTLVLNFSACKDSNSSVDLSEIDLTLDLERFEQKLFACQSVEAVMALEQSNPLFYPVYLYNILPSGGFHPSSTAADHAVSLYEYITIPDLDSLYKMTQASFGAMEDYKQELELAAKHINYYFPEERIEKAITFVSTFEYGSIFIEDAKAFAIGLEMYMGRNFEVYPQLDASRFPAYRVNKFEPYYIVPNAVKSFLYFKTPKATGHSFIDEAIYEGKILYAMDKLLPNAADSLKISYKRGDLEWCHENESNIWAYLVENDMIFSTDRNSFTKKFFNDGPFTTPFGAESAPRAGAFVGWQIVREYMERNPDQDLQSLFSNTDHQALFKASKYKP